MRYRLYCLGSRGRALVLLLAALYSGISLAQEPPRVETEPSITESKETPPSDRAVLPVADAALADSPGRGFGPTGNLFNPVVGHAVPLVEYRVTWLPDERVSGQPTVLGFVRQDISFGVPVWQCAGDEWAVTGSVRSELFHTGAVLPTTGQPFPDDLWSIRFGTTYRHLFDNGWIAGAALSIGSASDQPFHSINEFTGGVNLFLRIPQGEHNAWLFTLNYSPTNELAYPVPGVAFLWQPSDCLRVNIGLPFQVMWRPLDDLTLDVSYMLIRTVHARVTYRVCKFASAYAGYDWNNESWFLVDRPDVHDRFFYFEQRLSAGVRGRVGHWALYDVSSGFVFDRSFFEGKNSNSQNFNRIDVGDAPVLSLRLGLHF
jgi:hypothetical protein